MTWSKWHWWGIRGDEIFYNDRGDCSGEELKQVCMLNQGCSGASPNKATDPGDWLSGASIPVDMGATFL